VKPLAVDSLDLVAAAVPSTAHVNEASRALVESRLSAIAVLDAHERVVGFFTEDDLLHGLFPGYLSELQHTAFLSEDLDALLEGLHDAGTRPVADCMRRAVTVERGDAAAHIAERFLHSEWGALAVVERGRFVGMIRQLDFCRLLIERAGL
jgi:CBS-domain-containing membrane protein